MIGEPIKTGKRITDKSPTFLPEDVQLRMTRDHILVRSTEAIESQHIIAHWDGAPTRGVVVSVGPGTYLNVHRRGKKDGKDYHTVKQSTRFTPTEVKPGDVVELGGREIGGYLFQQVMIGAVPHIVCREQDVAFVDTRDRDERRTA